MKRTLGDAAQAAGGRLVGDDQRYSVVSSDSRTLEPGALFVALRGPQFDGADFVGGALERGAVGALVERQVAAPISQIVVADALAAVQALAAAWRSQFRHSDRRRGRQQRQDHGEGDDRGHPVAHGRVHGDPRQPQQPHRRAADPDAARARAPQRRGGDGREPHRRRRAARAARAAHGGAHHQCGRRASRGLRRPRRRCARARAKWWRACRADATAVINADDAYAGIGAACPAPQRVVTFGAHGGGLHAP